jgi:hypothetical protein
MQVELIKLIPDNMIVTIRRVKARPDLPLQEGFEFL